VKAMLMTIQQMKHLWLEQLIAAFSIVHYILTKPNQSFSISNLITTIKQIEILTANFAASGLSLFWLLSIPFYVKITS
jgi:hypothetical protein